MQLQCRWSRAFGGFHDAYKRLLCRRSQQRYYSMTARYNLYFSQHVIFHEHIIIIALQIEVDRHTSLLTVFPEYHVDLMNVSF